MDRFDQFLAALNDPGKYVRVSDVTVFDTHQEHGKDGRLVREFKKNDLLDIAHACNRRDRTGTLAPLVLGHTDPEETDETKQPAPIGYAKAYKVVWSPRLNKWVLTTDFYIAKDQYEKARTFPRVSVELWPGKKAKGEKGKWLDPPIVDPVSLLRRTPQLDLGAWTYERGDPRAPSGIGSYHYYRGGRTVLRYSMSNWQEENSTMPRPGKPRQHGADEWDDASGGEEETPDTFADPSGDDVMADPSGDDVMEDPSGDDMPPGAPTLEQHHSYRKHCAAHPYAKQMHDFYSKHYGMGEPEPEPAAEPMPDPTDFPDADQEMPDQHSAFVAPSATNAGIPKRPPARMGKSGKLSQGGRKPAPSPGKPGQGKGTRDGLDRYHKGQDPVLYNRVKELERENAARAKENQERAKREAMAEARNWAMALAHEGYEIDDDPKDGDVAKLALCYHKGGEAACERYADKVRQYRRTSITHKQGRVPIEPAVPRSGKAVDIVNDPESTPDADCIAIERYQKEHGLWEKDWAELAALALPQKYGRAGHSQAHARGSNGTAASPNPNGPGGRS